VPAERHRQRRRIIPPHHLTALKADTKAAHRGGLFVYPQFYTTTTLISTGTFPLIAFE
jgi:hypothetical protein